MGICEVMWDGDRDVPGNNYCFHHHSVLASTDATELNSHKGPARSSSERKAGLWQSLGSGCPRCPFHVFPVAEICCLLLQVPLPPAPHSPPWPPSGMGHAGAVLSSGFWLGSAPGKPQETRGKLGCHLMRSTWAGAVPRPAVAAPLKASCSSWSSATVPSSLWAGGW